MKIIDIEKRNYKAPLIELIQLDNDISLNMESSPPAGPDEGYLKMPEYLNNDSFKTV